jgi:YidC/Oxa1 family membrane protein insertase
MWDSLIVTPFVNVLLFIYQLVGNFGVAIILFTILIRLVTHPLTVKQLKGTKAMQDLQQDKRWLDIQKKYADDKERLAQEQMNLYKEVGYNPLSSCLPTLIQFPIIIGLYQSVIRSLVSTPSQLLFLSRHTYSWLDITKLIPLDSSFLWMDLGSPERLELSFLPFAIPVLAIVVMVTSFLQSKLMQPTPSGDGKRDQAAMMGNMMTIYMPLLMGYMAWSLASGLALYFLTSNIIAILQYAALGKLNWSNLLPSRKSPKARR